MSSLDLLPYLPYLKYPLWGAFGGAAVAWFGRDWTRRLFESEDKPSIRKVAFFLTVVAVLWHADAWPAAVLDALLVFAGALVGFGTAKIIGTRRKPAPNQQPATSN